MHYFPLKVWVALAQEPKPGLGRRFEGAIPPRALATWVKLRHNCLSIRRRRSGV
jgi:hypothetical protein